MSWEFCDASFVSHVIVSPSNFVSFRVLMSMWQCDCVRVCECAVLAERRAHNLIWFVVRGARAHARPLGHNGINRMATYHNGKNFSLSSVQFMYIYVTSTRCVIFILLFHSPSSFSSIFSTHFLASKYMLKRRALHLRSSPRKWKSKKLKAICRLKRFCAFIWTHRDDLSQN